jgi:hypothetical protein
MVATLVQRFITESQINPNRTPGARQRKGLGKYLYNILINSFFINCLLINKRLDLDFYLSMKLNELGRWSHAGCLKQKLPPKIAIKHSHRRRRPGLQIFPTTSEK